PTVCTHHVTPPGTQVAGRGERRIVDLVWAARTVTVTVGGELLPRTRDELHRPHRTIVFAVAVQFTIVGVRDRVGALGPVQRAPDDRFRRVTVLLQRNSAVPPVI